MLFFNLMSCIGPKWHGGEQKFVARKSSAEQKSSGKQKSSVDKSPPGNQSPPGNKSPEIKSPGNKRKSAWEQKSGNKSLGTKVL